MSQSFNPYHQWLGIESVSETPSYYELLGLRPLESDAGKINAAYQRQSGRLAVEFSGSQAELAQRLASELAEARMTLLTPTAKRAYDQAIATRGASAPANTTAAQSSPAQSSPAQSSPAAAPQAAANPVPISAAQPFVPQPAPQAAAPYAGQPYAGQPACPSAAAYGAGQPYPAAPAYPPAQAYPAWQAQQPVAYPTGVGQQPTAGYYGAPAAGYSEAVGPIQPEAAALPAVRRRRPARRRSSALPVLAVVAVCALGGLWYYVKSTKTVAVLGPQQEIARSEGNSQRPVATTPGLPRQSEPTAGEKANRDTSNAPPKEIPPPAISDSGSMHETPLTDGDMPEPATDRPDRVKPLADDTEPQSDKPETDKPEPGKALPVKPNDEPKPESNASAEELAAVGKVLKSARTALANRDITKAQDLLAEATIEASSPDMLAEVSRVETLASYVEMFWGAVRKTLPKIELEEIDLDGTMIVVVEADENHLVVRVEGRNREYTWQKIPTKIAYYLADRWLTREDPVRNLVLGAFEIVDPKGDRNRAQSLLDAASAAKLNARPLLEELRAAKIN